MNRASDAAAAARAWLMSTARSPATIVAYSVLVVVVLAGGLAASSLLFTGSEVNQVSRLAHRASRAAEQAQAASRRQRAIIARQHAIIERLNREIDAQCDLDGDIGTVPVTVNPLTGAASKLGVSIVNDSRRAWYGARCPGTLAAPSAMFLHWARVYHLRIAPRDTASHHRRNP